MCVAVTRLLSTIPELVVVLILLALAVLVLLVLVVLILLILRVLVLLVLSGVVVDPLSRGGSRVDGEGRRRGSRRDVVVLGDDVLDLNLCCPLIEAVVTCPCAWGSLLTLFFLAKSTIQLLSMSPSFSLALPLATNLKAKISLSPLLPYSSTVIRILVLHSCDSNWNGRPPRGQLLGCAREEAVVPDDEPRGHLLL